MVVDWDKPLHINTDQRLMMVVPEHRRGHKESSFSDDTGDIKANIVHYQRYTNLIQGRQLISFTYN